MIYTTMRRIWKAGCLGNEEMSAMERHLDRGRDDEEPLPLMTVFEWGGLEPSLRCLTACDGIEHEARRYAVWCAGQGKHQLADPESVSALEELERCAASGRCVDAEVSGAAKKAAWAEARRAARGPQ